MSNANSGASDLAFEAAIERVLSGERLTDSAVDQGELRAARLVASARQELEQDVRRARQELRQEVGDLAIAISQQLIRKSLNDADHRRIVDEAIARMGQRN